MAPALETLGLGNPLVAFVAQDPGQTRLLVARGLVLFAVLLAARGHGRRAQGAAALATAGSLFVLSLAARGLFVVDLVATAVIAIGLARGGTRRVAGLVAVLVAFAVILPALPVRTPAPVHAHVPTTAPEAVAYWRSRGNLYRAHAAAFAWAIGEATPAEGYLTLARIDWELGDHDRARRVLSKVLAKATSDVVLAGARELDSRWSR